jgi:hypothetical protein
MELRSRRTAWSLVLTVCARLRDCGLYVLLALCLMLSQATARSERLVPRPNYFSPMLLRVYLECVSTITRLSNFTGEIREIYMPPRLSLG